MRHKNSPASRYSQGHWAAAPRNAKSSQTSQQDAKPRIDVHFSIERLTIEGYSGAEQERFTRSLREHLNSLAQDADQRLWSGANGVAVAHLDAGGLARGATPEIAARQIATRIFAGLAQTEVLRK